MSQPQMPAYPHGQQGQGYPPTQGQGYPPPQGQPAPGGQGYPPPQGQPAPGGQGYPPPQGQPPAAGAALPATASAPALEDMEAVAGYGGMSFTASAMPPPPSYQESMPSEAPVRAPPSNMPVITEDQAREALLSHVNEHCCYGKGAAQDMSFNDLKSTSAFHYTLDTFTESRSTSWAFQPFRGQAIDSPNNGPAPAPWEVQTQSPPKFKNTTAKLEIPHTASIKPCARCVQTGRIQCTTCSGIGRTTCLFCHGRGSRSHTEIVSNQDHHHGHHGHGHHGHGNHGHGNHGHGNHGHGHHGHGDGHHGGGGSHLETHQDRCHHCEGLGRVRCVSCHGDGRIQCPTCQGTTNLKCFIELTIMWKIHSKDHIVERTALPDELIRGVTGQIAFEEEQPRVFPVNHFPEPAINDASRALVSEHDRSYSAERILLQRQRVRVIPVTEVLFKWKEDPGVYFVYGFENRVHAPSYPQSCCWGCTIL